MVSFNQIRQYFGIIETNWLYTWWRSFLVFVGKEKTQLLFHCIEHDNGIKIDKHGYNLVQVRNRLNFWYRQCAELKPSNQICEINISLVVVYSALKYNYRSRNVTFRYLLWLKL